MIDAVICGVCGKMGGNVIDVLKDDKDMRAVCGVDACGGQSAVPVLSRFKDIDCRADVIIDFSSPSALEEELDWATAHGVPVVLAVTGYSQNQLQLIENAAKKIAVFRTANFSLGVNLLVKLVKEAAKTLGLGFDAEIIERHHNQKADAPSGTALMLADGINAAYGDKKQYLYGRQGATGKRGTEIGIHAVRGGTIVGEHEVMFAGEDEIITLSHSARSKKVFAAGAVTAAKWLTGKPAGLYDMTDILDI